MSTEQGKIPTWFWIVGVVALLWNLMGVYAYIAQVTMSPEAMAKLSEAEQALYASVPAWATGAFALAVFGGALGCILLLLRNKLAVPVFIASLAGILVQMFYNVFMSKTMEVYGPGAISMPIMVVLIAVFLIWHARSSRAKGWIG